MKKYERFIEVDCVWSELYLSPFSWNEYLWEFIKTLLIAIQRFITASFICNMQVIDNTDPTNAFRCILKHTESTCKSKIS